MRFLSRYPAAPNHWTASAKRLPVRTSTNAKIALRLGGGEKHMVLGHADAVTGREWIPSRKPRGRLGGVSDRNDHGARKAQPRRTAADHVGDFGQHIGQQHVLTAENVSLANHAALECGEVAFGDVIDVDEIESGIEKSGHTSARRFDDDAPGRRRLDVAGPDRRRGIDDHRRQRIVGDHGLDQPLGGDLAALVGADPLLHRERNCLVRRTAVGAQAKCRDAAGIDDALDAGAFRLLHDDARAVHIGGKNLVRIARPEPIVGRDMKHVADASHGAPYRFCVADIAGDELQIEPVQVETRTVGSGQRAYREPFGNEFSRHGGPDQSRRPGDQSFCAAVHDFPCECGCESSIFTSKQPCKFHGKIELRHSH